MIYCEGESGRWTNWPRVTGSAYILEGYVLGKIRSIKWAKWAQSPDACIYRWCLKSQWFWSEFAFVNYFCALFTWRWHVMYALCSDCIFMYLLYLWLSFIRESIYFGSATSFRWTETKPCLCCLAYTVHGLTNKSRIDSKSHNYLGTSPCSPCPMPVYEIECFPLVFNLSKKDTRSPHPFYSKVD